MNENNDTNTPKDHEFTKYGVACHCSNGERPKDSELEKVAGQIGKVRCPCCGQYWIDLEGFSSPRQPNTSGGVVS